MFKRGDIVKIKNRRGDGWNSEGHMDCYCGTIVTLTKVSDESLGCKILEDNGKWYWNLDDFEAVSNIDYSEQIRRKEREKILLVF